MQTSPVLQPAPGIHRQQLSRQHRSGQAGPSLPVSLRFHQLISPSAPAVPPAAAQPAPSGHTISVDVRIGAASARSIAFRHSLETAYSQPGVGGGPHSSRRAVGSVITSLAALPASLPVPVPTGEDSREAPLKALPRNVENVADDPSLHNPLARLERLGTGWFGVVVEFEGVVVEDTSDLHTKAWVQLADEEGQPRPLQFALKRAEGMKNEQVVQEVFCWSRNPMEVRRLCARKEELYSALIGNHHPPVVPGVPLFLDTLVKQDVPAGVVSPAPEARVRPALQATGLEHTFQSVVTGDDVYRGRPDPEAYLFAAQQLGRPSIRCVVIGSSNQSVEAARECGMRAVVVAGRKPLYEMGAADLVVRGLDELSFINLKQLFSDEEAVPGSGDEVERELEPELEEEPPSTAVALDYWPQ